MLKTIDPKKLWIPVFCTGSAASAASAAITGPSARGRCRLLAWVDAGPWIGALPAPWFRGIAGPLVRGNAGPWIGAMPAPGFRAFILTASKSKINDETPLNSCSLRGRSSLFRDIVVLR